MAEALFLGLGSNLTDSCHRTPVDVCRWAVMRLAAIPGLNLQAISPWYRTAPVPASDQPDYINGVVAAAGSVDPVLLLHALHRIEAEAGRVRGAPNAARVLDLDLLAAGDLVRSGPGLVLPHPRMHERAFVLEPLCDVAPDWRHPVLGETAVALRDRLTGQRTERIPEDTQDLLLRSSALT